MLEDLPNVPPAVPLLVNELAWSDWRNFEAVEKRIRKLAPELRRQSEWYFAQDQHDPEPPPPGQLEIYADGGLNLFDPDASCQSIDCRVEGALRVSRSMGLLADTIWLTDRLSRRFVDVRRLGERDIFEIMDDSIVLMVIAPLIEAGIIKFKPSVLPVCGACWAKLEEEIDEIADHLVQLFEAEFNLEPLKGGGYSLSTGSLFDPPMTFYSPRRRDFDPAIATASAWDTVREAARKAVWVGFQAGMNGGSVFSNSKAGMAALAYREGNAPNQRQLRAFEADRRFNIPWVSELRPSQVVELRNEADKALPTFREALAAALEISAVKPTAVRDAIGALRQQAAEARAELQNAKKHSARFWKSSFVTLGFGVSAYGVATGSIPMALGGLAPLMQLMVNHVTGTEKEIDKIQRRPGYVLVKAQDILAHTHD